MALSGGASTVPGEAPPGGLWSPAARRFWWHRCRRTPPPVCADGGDSTVKAKTEVTVTLSEDERRERARRMIAEAFAERVPLTVEGEYKVIAGKDNRDAVTVSGVQANGEASDEREG